MASPDALSSNTQKAVLESLPLQHKQNANKALKSALWTAAGVAGYAAAVAVLPAAALPLTLMVAATVTVYNGFKLLGNASRALSLLKLKADVKDEKFVPKLKAKAGKALHRASRLNDFSQKAFYVTLGVLAASFVPVLAPIAAVAYPIAVLGMLGTWAASDWTKGTAEATTPTAKLVYQHQVAEGTIAPAERILPPGASVDRAPQKKQGSIFDMFKRKAANDSKPENKKPAPQAKLAPPKP